MIGMRLSDIADVVGGTLHAENPDLVISGETTTDSREVREGDVFVARVGEHADGFEFVPSAIAAGASLVIAERELPDDAGCAWIQVKDATEALGLFGAAVVDRARAEHGLRVVGITGSNGKTTTKNLVNTILSRTMQTVAPRGSYNNEVGAPTTFLRVTEQTDVLISEMGASRPGAIEYLTTLATPDIGVVLKVGLAHAGGFGDIAGTAHEKAAMVRSLCPDGVAILNRDDPWVVPMASETQARIVWFGLDDEADVRAEDIEVTAEGTRFTLCLPGGQKHSVSMAVLGEHHVHNALASAAICAELGVSPEEIVKGLESVDMAERGRMQPFRGKGITVIHDAYNASPDSMSAALKTLAQLRGPNSRTIAVLGHMRELGELDGEEHDRIGLQVVRLGIDQLVVVGAEARRLHISAINEGSWDGESVHIESLDDAYEFLRGFLRDGDIVLVKASNSTGLHRLAERLGEWLTGTSRNTGEASA